MWVRFPPYPLKICNKCKLNKADSEFHKRGSGLQPYCKLCKKGNDAQYRLDNIEYFRIRAKSQRKQQRAWLNSLKEGKRCVDCKGQFHPAAMHWHHPNNDKDFNISKNLNKYSRDKILTEINKCILLCANCHAIRHWGDF